MGAQLLLYHDKRTTTRGNLMDAMKGGARLKALREQRGWTQQQVADKAGVQRLTVLRIESGSTAAPTFEAAVLIGRALGLDPNEVARLYEI